MRRAKYAFVWAALGAAQTCTNEANVFAGAQGAITRVAPRVAPRQKWAPTRGALRLRVRDPSGSIPALVHQGPLLDPRHHGAQLLTDVFDRVRRHLGTHRLERRLVHPVLQHPVLDELARLDVAEDTLHLGTRVFV